MKIKADTIIRTVILIIALINQILTSTGHAILPINNETVTQIITLVITSGAALWSWWKNNSFTKKAIKADEVLDELKKE